MEEYTEQTYIQYAVQTLTNVIFCILSTKIKPKNQFLDCSQQPGQNPQ